MLEFVFLHGPLAESSVSKKVMKYYIPYEDRPMWLVEEKLTEKKDNTPVMSEPGKQENLESSQFSLMKVTEFLVAEKIFAESEEPLSGYLRSCLTMHDLTRLLNDYCSEHVLGVVSSCTDEGSTCLRRCLFLISNNRKPDDFLKRICKIPKDIRIYRFVTMEIEGIFERKILIEEPASKKLNSLKFRLECSPNTLENTNAIPPMFDMKEYSPLSHSLKRTLHILEKVSFISEVQELLDIAVREVPDDFNVHEKQAKKRHSFVVIEGMDATGKTTLTKTLEDKLNATRICQPPPCLQHLRSFFDDLPEIVRRAYYTVGNYITAVCIAHECLTRPVIADRFWHSTAVNAIANETTTHDLLPEGNEAYTWPPDLVRPDTVLFLTVSEETRRQRIRQRVEAMTDDERSLEGNTLLRQRLREAYKRMRNPQCVNVDASGTKDEVAERVSAVLLEQGLQ